MKKTTAQFAKEMLDKHNITLLSEYGGAHSKVSFTCKNGHENTAVATNLLQRGYNCKECKHGRAIQSKVTWTTEKVEQLRDLLLTKNTEDAAKELGVTASAINNAVEKFKINNSKTLRSLIKLKEVLASQNRQLISDNYYGANALVTVKCKEGHTLRQLAGNILYKGTGCPSCFSANKRVSVQEQVIANFIKENYSGDIEYNDRSILGGKELDIVIPDLGLAFEYNGTYWHSEAKLDKNYHLYKTEGVEAFGYQLIHIYEYDDLEIVKSRILQLLGKSRKIYARKCELRIISWPKEFLSRCHLQGAGAPTSVNYGLFYENNLVAVMTFAKPRYNKDYEWELIRYCSELNTTVVGGASKLLKAFNKKSIISYANRDWSVGNLYKTLGFSLLHATPPNYKYVNHDKILTRYQCQKHLLPNLIAKYDAALTEAQNMSNNGWLRIYDSGNLAFHL